MGNVCNCGGCIFTNNGESDIFEKMDPVHMTSLTAAAAVQCICLHLGTCASTMFAPVDTATTCQGLMPIPSGDGCIIILATEHGVLDSNYSVLSNTASPIFVKSSSSRGDTNAFAFGADIRKGVAP